MSAFLGRIHYWLYNKVLWHEGLLEELFDFAASKGIKAEEMREAVSSKYGYPDTRPLEEIIDHGNIHGWLQSKIQSVEYRIAAVVTDLIDKHSVKIEELAELYERNGVKAAGMLEEKPNSPQEVFTAVFDFMLAGMPCDRVHETVNDTDAEFTWDTTRCLHKEFWDAAGGDVANFYTLQDAWITGFVQAADPSYSFERSGGSLRTIRKG